MNTKPQAGNGRCSCAGKPAKPSEKPMNKPNGNAPSK